MYKDLQAIRGKFYIHRLIEEGEHEHQDFKFKFHRAVREVYCRPRVTVEMQAFLCDNAQVVLRASIPRAERRPVECLEEDGSWKAYYRVADENIAAHPLMVRAGREGRGLASVEDLMIDARLSRASAEDMIVRLAAAGIIGFEYRHPRFMLTVNS